MSVTRPQDPSSPPPGTRVGEYTLLTRIGEGGMGVVHLARAGDGRRVALKVLRPQVVGDEEARSRLAREVASLRRVRSPRVAEIVDADPWAEVPYVATRYVPGLSLHQHVREEGPVTGEDLRWFASCLAEAVVAVHAVGVLHRDIKPSNVLLEGRSPVLIDFGLARVADDPRLTATGWLLGTPGYLAPEILYGEEATAASDVHSWAATVAFAATGRPPFGRGPAVAVMDRVRRGEHDLTGVPADLRPLLERCLAAEPADRPELAAVLADLRATPPRSAPGGPERDDDMTVPFAVAAADDATTPVESDPATTPVEREPVTAESGPVTARLPQPAREPYVQPPPPRPWPPEPARSARTGLARLQRSLALVAAFAMVTTWLALAPYLTLALLAVTVLVVRAWSRGAEATRERRWHRGGNRWYDGPLAAVGAPWYLLLAFGGTLLLLLWATLLAVVVGLAYLLFGQSTVTALLLMGAAFASGLWWGPGSRRLRRSTRSALVRATRSPEVGWVTVAALVAITLTSAYALATGGVVWDPQPGPPWRPGTALGDLLALM